ncbi:MAG TPA: alpha/beta hydrolase [Steroidobacteraceae bacterium]|jgi:pimeloyl-ACP methyl ester carboxylesterase|nr:alpha/beta hydrolase [Steroidobacteraceae bacterium]
MKMKLLAGLALALSLLAPAFAAPMKFEAGALAVEQVSKKGPALILIPGLASGPWVWTDTVARLNGQYSIYLLTLPGFDGRKPVPGTTLASLSRDLATLIESRKIRKPVLVGHSLGGTLSLDFAAEHSDLIAGVVAVDGLPVFPGTEGVGDRSAMGQGIRKQFEGQTLEQFAAGQQAYMLQIGSVDEAIARKLAEFSSRSDIGATADFAAQVITADFRPRLASIKVPVVEISPFNAPDFAAMGIDENGKTTYYRGLLAGVEKLEVVSISGARHFVMFDQPEKFAAALDGALAHMVESRSK